MGCSNSKVQEKSSTLAPPAPKPPQPITNVHQNDHEIDTPAPDTVEWFELQIKEFKSSSDRLKEERQRFSGRIKARDALLASSDDTSTSEVTAELQEYGLKLLQDMKFLSADVAKLVTEVREQGKKASEAGDTATHDALAKLRLPIKRLAVEISEQAADFKSLGLQLLI